MTRTCRKHPDDQNMVWGCEDCKLARDFNERDRKNEIAEEKKRKEREKRKERKL